VAGLAVGPVNLDNLDSHPGEVSGQLSAVGTGAFHTHPLNAAVGSQPPNKPLIASFACFERLDANHTAQLVNRGSHV
jgi:hypothetical protein